jgi:hypothetical protein
MARNARPLRLSGAQMVLKQSESRQFRKISNDHAERQTRNQQVTELAILEEIRGVSVQHSGNSPDDSDGRVFLPTLDAAYVSRVDLRAMRQGFLRQPFGLSQSPYIAADNRLPIHGRMSGPATYSVEEL